jgi:hypothetical protein
MPQYIQEKEFDEKLQHLSDLYESAKNRLHDCRPPYDERAEHHSALFDIIQEMRDIAATSLRALYEIKES